MAKKERDFTVEHTETETLIESPQLSKTAYKRMEVAPREYCFCGEHMARFEKTEDWVCIRLLTGLNVTADCQIVPKELAHDSESLAVYEAERAKKRSVKSGGVDRELNVNPVVLERMQAAKDAAKKAGPKKRKFIEA